MLKMMPGIEDKVTFDAMRKSIVDVAAGSNFTEQDIAEVGDARIVHLLNRLAVLEAKNAKAQETVAQLKKPRGPRSVGKRNVANVSKIDRQVSNAIKSGNTEDKYAAMDALLI